MLRLRSFAVWLSVGPMFWGAGAVSGQNYPNKPIRIFTSESGGSSDMVARQIAHGISGHLGQQVIVENRAGIIAIETVAKAPPDGYTLLVAGNPLWLMPLMQKVSYDPVRDFLPITLATSAPTVLIVHPLVPVKSVKDLIALAKARPGELNYASVAVGSSTHLAAELFKVMAGVNIVRISYRGTGLALNALLSGEVQLMMAPAVLVTPHVNSGRLRALAVTSAHPSALVPGLPTVAASGLPGYEAVGVFCVFAPAKTPTAIIIRLNQEIVQFLNQAEVREKFSNAGIESIGSSPEQFSVSIKSEVAKWGKLIKDAGIRAE